MGTNRKTGVVAAYARVSTDDQTHASQMHDLKRALQHYGDQVAWYKDTASGAAESRPGLEKLAKDVAAGKVERVVVWALDRLSRKGIMDGLQLLATWTAKGVVVESIREPWVAATADAALRELLLSIAFWGARQERVKIQERTRSGLRAAKARGVVLGRKKGDVGHRWGLAKRKIDPAMAKSLREQGVSVADVAKRFNVSRAAVYIAMKEA